MTYRKPVTNPSSCLAVHLLSVHLSRDHNHIVVFRQVEELRRDLRVKSLELEAKNSAANDKLKKMVKDQQEAEKKKARRPNRGFNYSVLLIFFFFSSPQKHEFHAGMVHASVCVCGVNVTD